MEPAPVAAAGLGRWLLGVAVLPVCGAVLRRRQHYATTAHRALPVCGRPALGMPWGTARSNAASSVQARCGGICTGGCGRAGLLLCCEGCGFASLWRFPEHKRLLPPISPSRGKSGVPSKRTFFFEFCSFRIARPKKQTILEFQKTG